MNTEQSDIYGRSMGCLFYATLCDFYGVFVGEHSMFFKFPNLPSYYIPYDHKIKTHPHPCFEFHLRIVNHYKRKFIEKAC